MSSNIKQLGELIPDPHNARYHNDRNINMIETSLGEVGAARSIVIDEHGRILAGNATVQAAARAGIETVQIVDTDGSKIIAVQRSGLTEDQKRRLALFDNQAAAIAEWDTDQLKIDFDEGLLDNIFSTVEVSELEIKVPNFTSVGADEQPRLDQKAAIICPHCNEEFIPE